MAETETGRKIQKVIDSAERAYVEAVRKEPTTRKVLNGPVKVA